MARRRAFGRVFRRRRRGRRSRRWSIRYSRQGREQEEHGFRSEALALARLAQLAERVATSRWVELPPQVQAVTVADLVPVVMAGAEARMRPDSVRALRGRLAIAAEWFGARTMKDIRERDVADFLTWLGTERRCSGATRNRYRNSLSLLWREGIARDCASVNMPLTVKAMPERPLPRPYLQPLDLDRVLAHTRARYRPPLTIAVDCGMRRSEVVFMEWSWLDLTAPDCGAVDVPALKGRHPRRIPMTPRARATVDALRAERDPVPLRGPDRVFPWLRRDGFTRAAKAALTAAGPPAMSLQSLRHVWASSLVRSGTSIPVVGAMLGHAPRSLTTTLRYAVHSPTDAGVLAMRALAAARGQAPDAQRAQQTP